MRRYDDLVEVHQHDETPDQFLWRGRLWQVREVVSHWVETGSWWRQDPDAVASADLLGEREVWRVAAARGRVAAMAAMAAETDGHPGGDPGFGVFDLSFDWASGDWRLAGAVD